MKLSQRDIEANTRVAFDNLERLFEANQPGDHPRNAHHRLTFADAAAEVDQNGRLLIAVSAADIQLDRQTGGLCDTPEVDVLDNAASRRIDLSELCPAPTPEDGVELDLNPLAEVVQKVDSDPLEDLRLDRLLHLLAQSRQPPCVKRIWLDVTEHRNKERDQTNTR